MADSAPANYIYCPHCGGALETRQVGDRPVGIRRRHDQNHADTAVEHPMHLRIDNLPVLAQPVVRRILVPSRGQQPLEQGSRGERASSTGKLSKSCNRAVEPTRTVRRENFTSERRVLAARIGDRTRRLCLWAPLYSPAFPVISARRAEQLP